MFSWTRSIHQIWAKGQTTATNFLSITGTTSLSTSSAPQAVPCPHLTHSQTADKFNGQNFQKIETQFLKKVWYCFGSLMKIK